MKYFKLLAIFSMLVLPVAAHAQTANGTGTVSSQTQTEAQGNAYAIAQGNQGYQHSSIATTPALATLLNSPTAPCEETYSGTAAVTGFGLGISGSKTNQTCQALEIIRATYNMQQQSTAVLMMCQFQQFRFARAVEGHPCPAAFNQPGDTVVTQAAPAPALASDTVPVGNSLATYQVSPSTSQPTPSVDTPTHSIPSWCADGPSSADSADQASYNYYCK